MLRHFRRLAISHAVQYRITDSSGSHLSRQQLKLRFAYQKTIKPCFRTDLRNLSLLPHSYQIRLCSSKAGGASWDEDVNSIFQDDDYNEFSARMLRLPQHGHNVLVIQPYIKVGEKKKMNTTPQLQLEEAIALIHSLPRWKVLDSDIIPLQTFSRNAVFGKGTLEKLKDKVKRNHKISAVFISVNILKTVQLVELQSHFDVPIYDRYTVVIQIFRNHAETREAKLQIAMAEIPYLKQCIRGFPKGLVERLEGAAGHIGGSGDHTFGDTRRRLLQEREKKLQGALLKLRSHRERLRLARSRQELPTVAVVGYTNSGKTSLIKALTGEEKLKPRDQLFATLDVTRHAGLLPCNLRVLFVDTVGFITDIPTDLLESFTATLEDAMYADIIIHIWDISNPDFQCQREHVWKTLQTLNLKEGLIDRVLEVGNKVDKVSDQQLKQIQDQEPEMVLVSAKTGAGLSDMLMTLEKTILESTSRLKMVMRVKTGGLEYSWLQKEATVSSMEVDTHDEQYCLLNLVISQSQFQIFKHRFIANHK